MLRADVEMTSVIPLHHEKMMENYVIYLETASICYNVYIISVKAFFFLLNGH